MYVDLTVASALSQEALSRGSALKDGIAAKIAADRKLAKYPGCATYPFPIEEHGRLGEAALTFAKLIAPVETSLRSKGLATLYQSLGSALQRASADAIIAAAG